MSKILSFLFLVLLFATVHSVKIELPVSQLTLAKLTLSIDKLEDLLAFFNTRLENKGDIYRRVELTKGYLDEMRTQLARYNNVVAGQGNSVQGQKNLVIGNFNKVQGDNNWVFVSKFGGKINGVLLVGEWMIELEKSQLILKSPRLAISYIDEEKNIALRQTYANDNRQLVKWDSWAKPQNNQADKHWSKYVGYEDWKVANWDRKNLRVDLDNSKSWSWNSQNTMNGWSGSTSTSSQSTSTGSWSSSFTSSTNGGATNLSNFSAGSVPSVSTSKNFTQPATSAPVRGSVPAAGWVVGSNASALGKWLTGWSSAK